jgi:hypothetical protein
VSGGFSADWLALRETADARSRSELLEARLVQEWLARSDGARVPAAPGRPVSAANAAEPPLCIDLGAGTGANVRHLAPRLPGAQRWRLLDADAGLLAIARTRCANLRAADGAPVAISCEVLDLAHAPLVAPCAGASLVTASALLDLVSESWLTALAAAVAASNAIALFVLDYEGRRNCAPREPDDALAHQAFDQHQRRDKGFGPALGPTAAARAAAAFEALGYRTQRARSDWLLDAGDAELQRELLAGWWDAASEAGLRAPDTASATWEARRLQHVARGASRLTIGHEDLLAWP